MVRILRIVVLESVGVEHVGHPHRDPFRAALREYVGAIDLLAVDFATLEEFGDLLEIGPGLRCLEFTVVLLLELGAQLGLGEPVFAVGPAERVAHRRQGPVVGRVLGPFRIAQHRGRHEVAHLDAFLVEEIVELDVVPVLGGAPDPLAVADQQIAQLALGVQLVDETVGKAGPGHELELHCNAGLGGEILRQLD